jgi:hypothetical protein
MLYRCIKVQHKPINIQVRDQIQKRKRNQSVLRNGAPDCPVCQDQTAQTSYSRGFPGALRYNSSDFPVWHRTVRCTSKATANSRNGRLWRVNSACQKSEHKSEVHRTVSGVAPDCPMPQEDTIDRVRTLTVGWRDGAPDSVRWCTGLSGAPIDSSLPQRAFGGWWL